VVISIQTEIIQALNLARAVDSAVLDFTALYESSVTARKDATRAMDQLCQRIMASMQFQPRSRRGSVEVASPSTPSLLSSYANLQPIEAHERSDKSLPSLPSTTGSPSPITQPTRPNRTHIAHQHSEAVFRTSQRMDSPALSDIWELKAPYLHSSPTDNDTFVSRPILNMTQEQQPNSPNVLGLAETSRQSIGESGLAGESGLEHGLGMSNVSVATSADIQRLQSHGPVLHQRSIPPPEPKPPPVDPYVPAPDLGRHVGTIASPDVVYHTPDISPASPPTPAAPTALISRIETPDDLLRALEAPEVVTKDFGVMFSMRPIATSPASPTGTADKYLAYAEALFSLSPGMDNIWAPLSRPAMHNRYHGFCKGAWQMRKAVSTLRNAMLLDVFVLITNALPLAGS
jgi:hypothetical protein